MKLNKSTKSNKSTAPFTVIGIGSKGTGFVVGGTVLPESANLDGKPTLLPWTSFKTAGVSARSLCDTHAKGKAVGGALTCYDAQCHLSEKGKPVLLLPLAAAIAKKVVRAIRVRAVRDGFDKVVTAYVRADWRESDKFPAYLASPDVPAGRMERGAIHEVGGKPSRNAGLTYRVSPLTAGAEKPAKPAPSKPAKPAKK